MSLKLMYITNNLDFALVAEKHGVDRIWIDLETIGKSERQKNMNTVKSNHTINDIYRIRPCLNTSEMLVRVNPIHLGSEDEINAVIDAGADIIMLPMWKCPKDVETFLSIVRSRVKTTLLLETKEAVECIDDVLHNFDFNEIHIGLNDLHLSYGLTFMFELLSNGVVEQLCYKFKEKGVPFGFGGIACLGQGMLPAENIIMEHYRLGSTRAILSRSFFKYDEDCDIDRADFEFGTLMDELRTFEADVQKMEMKELLINKYITNSKIQSIVSNIKENQK